VFYMGAAHALHLQYKNEKKIRRFKTNVAKYDVIARDDINT